MIVTPTLYLAAVALLWLVIRAPWPRRTKAAVLILAAVLASTIYWRAGFLYFRNVAWASNERRTGETARLERIPNLMLPDDRSCGPLCLELLVGGFVDAVVTRNSHRSIGAETALPEHPLMEWRIGSGEEQCASEAAEQLTFETTLWAGHMALLAQDRCLLSRPLSAFTDGLEIRRTKVAPAGSKDGVRTIWSLTEMQDGIQRELSAVPFWAFQRPAFPPFVYFRWHFIQPMGFTLLRYKAAEGPADLPAFLSASTGIDVTGERNHAGPLLVSDPLRAISEAIASGSPARQRSALALMCLLGSNGWEEARPQLELLIHSSDFALSRTASRYASTPAGPQSCPK